MPQDPLLTQLAERCRTFSAGTGVSLHKIAKLVGMEPSNFSNFINGHIGLSAKATIKLLQLLNLSRQEVEMKLSAKTVHVEHLQQEGQLMKLDSGGSWVPGQSGDDPNDTTGIDNTWKEGGDPSDDDLIDTLRQIDNFHRQAREAIADWFARAGKAHPNANGSTESPRKITDSRKPGSRGDLLSVKPAEMLAYLERERVKAEADLEIQKKINIERKRSLAAQIELADARKETLFSK